MDLRVEIILKHLENTKKAIVHSSLLLYFEMSDFQQYSILDSFKRLLIKKKS